MSIEIKVGDLVECKGILGRVAKIETVDGKLHGTIDGVQHLLANFAWVPDSEQIRRLSEQQKQQHFKLKRSQA